MDAYRAEPEPTVPFPPVDPSGPHSTAGPSSPPSADRSPWAAPTDDPQPGAHQPPLPRPRAPYVETPYPQASYRQPLHPQVPYSAEPYPQASYPQAPSAQVSYPRVLYPQAPSGYGPDLNGAPVVYHPVDPRAQAYQNALYSAQRSRIAAGLLALFLGGLGIHNFYLGRSAIGAVQLLLTVLTLGLLAPVSAIWALIEAIMIFARSPAFVTDAKGIPLRD